MILDHYIVKATSGITAQQLFEACAKLYPESGAISQDYEPEIERWLKRLRNTKPGAALSTGRRNSLRGELTCALLEVLEVPHARAKRNRMELAWAILDSPVGAKHVGPAPELNAVRPKRGLS